MHLLLIIILIAVALSVIPAYSYRAQWGYYPLSGVGTVLAILLILWLLGILR